MKAIKYLLPIVTGLVFSTACRDRDEGYESRPKTVEVEVDKDRVDVDVRERDRSELRSRLARLDDKIAELRARGSEEASETADKLRVRRDELAAKLDKAGDQAADGWDGFKRDVNTAFDEIEHDLDEAF